MTFTVTGGAGTINNGGGLVAGPLSVATDASGIATLNAWSLGATAGANSLTAAVGGLSGSPVTFTATGTAGAGVDHDDQRRQHPDGRFRHRGSRRAIGAGPR